MTSQVLLNCKSIGNNNHPNVVILHGLFGDLNNWRAQAEKLSEHYHVHSMDLRNHGASPHAPGMAYPLMAADVAYTCQSLDITSTHIIGHSMGGKTAMQLALQHPDLVARLIVVDIGPRRYEHQHKEVIKGMKLLANHSLSSRSEGDKLLQPFVPDNGTRSFLLKNLSRNNNKRFQLRINIDGIAANYHDIAERIEADEPFSGPTLFIKGAESDYLNDKDREPIAALFSNPSLKTIAGAGHWPHSEKPEVIYKIVSDFLAAPLNTDRA